MTGVAYRLVQHLVHIVANVLWCRSGNVSHMLGGAICYVHYDSSPPELIIGHCGSKHPLLLRLLRGRAWQPPLGPLPDDIAMDVVLERILGAPRAPHPAAIVAGAKRPHAPISSPSIEQRAQHCRPYSWRGDRLESVQVLVDAPRRWPGQPREPPSRRFVADPHLWAEAVVGKQTSSKPILSALAVTPLCFFRQWPHWHACDIYPGIGHVDVAVSSILG